MSMTCATGPSGLPSHAAVLEGLRRVCFRQVVRYQHDPLFDALARMAFVAWVRQPVRLSQQPVSVRSQRVPTPVEVAELTDTGRAALDWLAGLEQSDQWLVIRARPYGMPHPSNAS